MCGQCFFSPCLQSSCPRGSLWAIPFTAGVLPKWVDVAWYWFIHVYYLFWSGEEDVDWQTFSVGQMMFFHNLYILLFLFYGCLWQTPCYPSRTLTKPLFQFTGAYVDYTKSYCWIKNTYYIAMDEAIPLDVIKRENEELTYYQWVPLILLLQASTFC